MTSVRQIGISDILSLGRIRRAHISLTLPETVFRGRMDDLMAALPFGRRYARVFVADSDGPIRAIIELRPVREDYRWIVTGLGARVPRGSELSDDVSLLWADLLSQASRVAGRAGAKRVHASVSQDTLVQDTLIRAGFSVYSHRSVLRAQRLQLADSSGAHVRERDPSDAWSIHHLYHLTTPRPVQYAEALTSNHWDTRRTLNAHTRGFVMDDDGGLAGYCQITSRGQCHALDIIMLPSKLDMLGPFVSQAIRLADAEGGTEFWVSVPDYHLEYRSALDAIGFQQYDRQSLMVRYTMVPVNGRHARWTNVVTDVIERLPARTPVVSRWEPDGA